MKFKVGDTVQIIDNKSILRGAREYIGKTAVITSAHSNSAPPHYHINIDNGIYKWFEESLILQD